MRVHELYCEFAPQLRRVVLLGRRERQTRVVNRLGRAPSEAEGVAFGCAGAFRIGLQSGVHVACIGPPPPPSRSTEKSWPHFWPSAVDFCGSRLAIGAATERARALAMSAGTRAQALQTLHRCGGCRSCVAPSPAPIDVHACSALLLSRAGAIDGFAGGVVATFRP